MAVCSVSRVSHAHVTRISAIELIVEEAIERSCNWRMGKRIHFILILVNSCVININLTIINLE
jgi:hypothetical protein